MGGVQSDGGDRFADRVVGVTVGGVYAAFMSTVTEPPAAPARDSSASSLLRERYRNVRAFSDAIAAPLEVEDQVVQTMPDVSPTRWHRAHTTWFFETFVLKASQPGYRSPNDAFEVLFNSYYNSVGEQFPRDRRGHLTRPTVREVDDYRCEIDDRMSHAFDSFDDEVLTIVELGLHHEQQHQELMLTDIKHVLAANPLDPAYLPLSRRPESSRQDDACKWIEFPGGLEDIGYDGDGFFFDNEQPRHPTYCQPFALADQPVTCGDWLAFIDDGGYDRPELWTALGWSTVNTDGWAAPLYWRRDGSRWSQFTLYGRREVEPTEPVTHISWLEADAFARWSDARLPTETEWERACVTQDFSEQRGTGHFADELDPHPRATSQRSSLRQMLGSVWEWTASPYTPYPGFRPVAGALGEYNGKFMTQQYVLRGGSCVTSRDHIRPTYRNFFPPDARWQFSGLRLARDV